MSADDTREQWGRAFAQQAKADLDAWDLLNRDRKLPQSQKLHFLQMACEKLAKAHLLKAGAESKSLFGSHAFIAKHLPVIIREQWIHAGLGGAEPSRDLLKHAKYLAREIELLAPAVDDGGRRPDNCEYPWREQLAAGKIRIPAEYTFNAVQMLMVPSGRTFLKIVRVAIESFGKP